MYVCVCVSAWVHACIRACVCTCTVCSCVHVCVHACVCACMYMPVHVQIHAHIHVWVCAGRHLRACLCPCMCNYACMWCKQASTHTCVFTYNYILWVCFWCICIWNLICSSSHSWVTFKINSDFSSCLNQNIVQDSPGCGFVLACPPHLQCQPSDDQWPACTVALGDSQLPLLHYVQHHQPFPPLSTHDHNMITPGPICRRNK